MKKFLLLITILILIGAGFIFKYSLRTTTNQLPSNPKQVFTKFQNFKPAQRVSFKDQQEFNPKKDLSFSVIIWLRFKEITKQEQRTFILRKYSQKEQTGYALAFNQFEDGFYPQIFWTKKQEGKWLTFQKFKPQPHRWYGFLLTFTDNKYLGLHLLKPEKVSDQISLKNLGGYILEDTFPISNAKLEIGSIGTKIFNGSIAKVSFYKSDSKNFELLDFLETLKSASVDSKFEEYPSYDLEFEKIQKSTKKTKDLNGKGKNTISKLDAKVKSSQKKAGRN